MISVIMSVYNSKNLILLRKSIESILNQTYRDIEFLICDDNSTNEEIGKILMFYSNIDNRIKIIKNKKNMGLAFSLNACLKIAQGDYIARQDDDDISFNCRLEEEYKYIRNNQLDFVGCNLNLIRDNKVWGQREHPINPSKFDLARGPMFSHPTLLISRNALFAVDGYTVSKDTLQCEDYDLYMKLYSKGFSGGNLQKILYNYSQNINTLKKRKFSDRISEMKIRFKGFKILKLPFYYYIYVFKPLLSFFVPAKVKLIRCKKKFKIVNIDSKNEFENCFSKEVI